MSELAAPKISPRRFNPPHDGLEPRENVVWARRKGTSFWLVFFGGLVGIGGLVCTVNAFVFVGLVLGAPLLVLMLVGFFFMLRAFLRGRGTRYYLTNERLIEARKGQIVQEVSLERFVDKPLSQFFEKRVTHTVNDQPVYTIRIYDPLSADTLIEFKDLDRTSIEALERIGQSIRCPYCSFQNMANSQQCKHCGAPL